MQTTAPRASSVPVLRTERTPAKIAPGSVVSVLVLVIVAVLVALIVWPS